MFTDADLNFVRIAFKNLNIDDYGTMGFEDDETKEIIQAGVFEFTKQTETQTKHSILGDTTEEVPVIGLSAIYECTGYDGMPDWTEDHYGTFKYLHEAIMQAYMETERWAAKNAIDSALWEAYKDTETLDEPF